MFNNKKPIILLSVCIVGLLLTFVITLYENAKDPDYNKQWYLYDEYGIDAEKMWNQVEHLQNKNNVTIAIIDTGIDFSTIELEGREWTNSNDLINNNVDDDNNGYIDDRFGYSFIDNCGEDWTIDNYHGTACAGVIAAKHNGKLIEGVVGELEVSIMSIKVLDSADGIEGEGSIDTVIDGIKYAEQNGADVCNLSFSTYQYSETLKKCMEQSDMIFVTSAGNKPSFRRVNIDKKPIYPACFGLNNIISVLGTNQDGGLSTVSNYGGNTIDVAAPGEDICVLCSDNEVKNVSGVSMAVPQVSAIAAVLLSLDTLGADEVIDIIKSSVKYNSKLKGKCKTEGIVNGYNAIIEFCEKKEGKHEKEQ